MSNTRSALLGLWLATATLTAGAQDPDEHKDHHPAGGAAAPATTPNPASPSPASHKAADDANMPAMDQHMKAMQTLHEKLAAAKTPEERQALMAEHMKLMREGMGMMKKMGGATKGPQGKKMPMADRQNMLEKRMDMMEAMMQMMMDTLPAAPAKQP